MVPAAYLLLLLVFQFGHVCELQDTDRGHGAVVAASASTSHSASCPACAVERQAGAAAPAPPPLTSLAASKAVFEPAASDPRAVPQRAPFARPPPAC
jgi:hypothetical protein